MLPSSPALASISPKNLLVYGPWLGQEWLYLWVQSGRRSQLAYAFIRQQVIVDHSQGVHTLINVVRYVTVLSSPLTSTLHKRTLLSPPPVAKRPFPCGSKWAEYMGVLSLCQDTSNGEAFMIVGSIECRLKQNCSICSGTLGIGS